MANPLLSRDILYHQVYEALASALTRRIASAGTGGTPADSAPLILTERHVPPPFCMVRTTPTERKRLLSTPQHGSLAITLRIFEQALRQADVWLQHVPDAGTLYRRVLHLRPTRGLRPGRRSPLAWPDAQNEPATPRARAISKCRRGERTWFPGGNRVRSALRR